MSERSATRTLPLVLLVLCLSSCEARKNSADKETPSQNRAPTAAEVFDLRSKCAALGEKILNENVIGNALAQIQLTHYNPQTNRCYVRLEVSSTTKAAVAQGKFTNDLYLFDGQTNEMLARAWVLGDQKVGYIAEGLVVAKPGHPTGFEASYDDALALIDKYMADDRKQ